MDFLAWFAGGLFGIIEAFCLQNPFTFFRHNIDRTVYFYAFLTYGFLSWLFYRILLHPLFTSPLKITFFFYANAAILFLTALYGWIPAYQWNPPQTSNNSGKPNIVLITLDTTRADHLSCYGYSQQTTPFLDSLGKQGTLFLNAYTSATWTLPSHASLFTGQIPSVHGVGYENFFASPRLVTLAEILKQNGYVTAAFTGGPFLASNFHLDQGFDYYDEKLDEHSNLKRLLVFRLLKRLTGKNIFPFDGQRHASELNQDLFPYLKWVQKRQPFFLFINYFDPHEPYDPPEAYRKWLNVRSTLKGNIRFYPLNKQTGIATHPGGTPLSEEDFAQLKALYDAELRSMDSELQNLFDQLRRKNLVENTLFIITSDHGETIGEHGFLDHGHNLYQEQMRVPLILAGMSWNKGTIMDHPVQLIDIYPTVLEQLQIKVETPIQGQNLFVVNPERSIFAENDSDPHPRFAAFGRSQRTILKGTEKFIESSNGNSEYYLLPDERVNLLPADSPRVNRLKRELHSYFEAVEKFKHVGKGKMDDETREKLKALGYIE